MTLRFYRADGSLGDTRMISCQKLTALVELDIWSTGRRPHMLGLLDKGGEMHCSYPGGRIEIEAICSPQ